MFKIHLIQMLPLGNYLRHVAQSFVQSSSISKARDSITFLGSLFLFLTTHVLQPPPNIFIMHHWNFLFFFFLQLSTIAP